jgi:hypothetical protein
MMKKIITASIVLVMLAAIVPASLADSGDIKPYKGMIGADSPLYPVKIYVQHLDVYLTFNDTAKMLKEMNYADERLSEAEAAILANDTAAVNASLDEYLDQMNELNDTTQASDIDPDAYANLSPMLYHHGQTFYALMNNTTPGCTFEGRMMNVSGNLTKMKNGMPFYYYNGTAYFIPPGQMKLIANGSKVPPGLAGKGYVRPVPTIMNGSMTWPWDEINYSYANTTIPGKNMNKTHGNGNGKGNGNGNNK